MIELSPTERIKTVTSENFISRYKESQKPVIIEQLTKDWPAREKWNVEYIKKVAGENIVPLYDSKPSTDRKHQHAPAARMKIKSYLDLLHQGENDLRMFFYNILAEAPQLTEDFSYPDIGLKLFKKLPVLFFGGKGAKVQMHYDIDLADILLCHFGGKKRVYLFPPEQTKYIYRVPFSFSSLFDIDYENPDYEKYPALRNLKGEIAELDHGDVLYIPSGYWHYIVYEDISFSMALRAFPRKPKAFSKLIYNLVVVRNIDGLMRKFIGQSWNERNERMATFNTHKKLGINV
ncbi:MAG TPA: cupin-like domain-containing protein [Chromatiales bacterium]|nr:cupin-like domain-containing protein [Thiotrichales bacterium]HIP67096.1 cupin-like domain-containing protein [Chromatiales bacterium]